MKNIHVLPTPKPSRLFTINGKLYNYHKPQQGDGVNEINQNIYITSDEEITSSKDWFYYKHFGEDIVDKANQNTDLVNLNNPDRYFKKIIAYQPKNNAKELNLPLLPELVVEDSIQNFIEPILKKKSDENNRIDLNAYALGLIDSYKAATKVYSEEDAEKIYMLGYMDAKDGKNHHNEKLSDYLQSLKQPTPTWFVAEMQTTKSEVFRENDNVPYATLKTTTINGKTYLVGKFVNE
jgi:hypothetical protein